MDDYNPGGSTDAGIENVVVVNVYSVVLNIVVRNICAIYCRQHTSV